MHDLVIRNGNVVDGTGAPARVADVAIDKDENGVGIVTAIGHNGVRQLWRRLRTRPTR